MQTLVVRSVPGHLYGLPRRLFDLAGEVPPAPRVAIVGSRAALRSRLALVASLVDGAAARGVAVVSGGALGIDAEVHRVAAGAGVPQLAVLPCGADRLYPPDHRDLFAAIPGAPRSGVLFAQPRGTVPVRGMFASRNALILDLAQAVVVVQAAARSGSLGTGRLALRRTLPVAIVPGSRGTGLLLAAGAHALPGPPDGPGAVRAATESWLDAVLGGRTPSPSGPDAWPDHLGWLRRAVERAGTAGLDVDALPDPLAGLAALTEAETRGLVTPCGPGRYTARSRRGPVR